MGFLCQNTLTILQLILGILVLVSIIKLFFETNIYQSLLEYITTIKNENIKIEEMLKAARIEAFANINRSVEKSFSETSNTNTHFNPNEYITSYLNRSNRIKLELYYKPSCPHSKTFMPIWSKIINDLPSDATYEEINCESSNYTEIQSKINENKITSVPSLVLIVDNQKKFYIGSRTYHDIAHFLNINGVYLVKRTFENFNTTSSNTNINNYSNTNPHCPAVSFDKQIDIANDNYMYQIFNAEGQYGYASGGYNSNKLLTPFQAAYSTVDSYLSSLPDDTDPYNNSYKHVNQCASLYANNIINFGLCDIDKLNTIQEYQSNVSSGISNTYIDGTDYSNNTKVIDAIKNACGFNS